MEKVREIVEKHLNVHNVVFDESIREASTLLLCNGFAVHLDENVAQARKKKLLIPRIEICLTHFFAFHLGIDKRMERVLGRVGINQANLHYLLSRFNVGSLYKMRYIDCSYRKENTTQSIILCGSSADIVTAVQQKKFQRNMIKEKGVYEASQAMNRFTVFLKRNTCMP